MYTERRAIAICENAAGIPLARTAQQLLTDPSKTDDIVYIVEVAMENKFMHEAIRLAVKNVKNGGGPFAALVVRNNEVLSTGVNLVAISNDPTAHAEIVAIRNACRKLKSFQLTGCDVYTSCEPCPMCLGAIYWARPRRIFFGSTRRDALRAGFDDSFIYQQLKLPHSRRKIPCKSILRHESLRAFAAWKEHSDKIPY